MINIKGIDYYRIDEAAEKMGVSISFLYKQRRDGTIGSIQVDRVIWINSEQIEEFFNRYKVVAKTTYSIVEKENEIGG
ncbi:helix-turn-helix domain-containing protein [Treponema denticola]|nr:helix-turn-helix domain-containing protein [Treponema denticola]UTC82686.1 helix-turn-helix domain-containing protein [Treponema denticola]